MFSVVTVVKVWRFGLYYEEVFSMGLVLTHLRGMKRLITIGFILLRQFMILIPYRLIFAPSAKIEKTIGKYLSSERPRMSAAEIAKETLEKLGPTYVKFGQFLSVRPDLVPPGFCEEFKKLQDCVPSFPFALVQRELRNELTRDYTEIFSEFDETPMAAASVSQVHRARLRTGEEVAVKVQRPGIREAMISDLFIMLRFAHLIERFIPSLRKNRPVMLVQEFTRWTERELYFRQEGKNALHFSHNFKDYPGVKIPKVYREYTTRKILVMEHIRGVNILHASERGIDKKAMARLIADSMLKQIFIDGFFHGDPHAGNIMLVDSATVAYLDFGIVGYLSEDLRAWIFDILCGMSAGDVTRVIGSFLELCNVSEDDIDLPGYRREMNEVLSELPIYEAAGIPFSQMLERFLNTSLEFGIRIPHDFVLVSKALTTFEGTCLTLDPDINIVEHLRSFVRKYIATSLEFEDALKQMIAAPFELGRLKRLVLKHGARAMKFFENPTVRLSSEAAGAIANNGDATGVNIAYGFIIAALILFAALLGNESALDRGLRSLLPMPRVPLLPLASLAGAGCLWVRLMVRNRSKKRKNNG
jgi:ubiquinone biosynthesis protein